MAILPKQPQAGLVSETGDSVVAGDFADFFWAVFVTARCFCYNVVPFLSILDLES